MTQAEITEYNGLIALGYEVWKDGSYSRAMSLFDRAEAIKDRAAARTSK